MATITAAAGGGNWTVGGTWVGGIAPTAADDALLTGTSGNVTIDTGAVCRSLDCTGYTGTLTHNAGVTFAIGDATAGLGNNALKFVAGMTLTNGSATTSLINFVSTSATQQTITWGSKAPASVNFGGAGSSYLFNDGYTNTGADLSFTAGTVNVNGQTLSVRVCSGGTATARTVTLGAASITCGSWNFSTTTNLTFNANTSTITATGTSTTFSGGGLTYSSVVLSGTFPKPLLGANTFTNLTFTGPATKTGVVSIFANQTITGTLTINGNSATNRLLVASDTIGTTRTLTASNAPVVTNADFRDITGAGAGSWNLSAISGGAGDCLGNSGITFTTAVNRFAVVSGNWSDTATWSATTGGGGGASVPLPQDGVFLDALSAAGTYTMDMPRIGRNVDFSGFTQTLSITVGPTLFGSLTLASAMTFPGGSSGITFLGRSSLTITWAGKSPILNLVFQGPGSTYTLQDDIVIGDPYGAAGDVIIDTGTFTANNHNVTANSVRIAELGGTPTVNMGTGTWTVRGTGAAEIWIVGGSATINASTSLIDVVSTVPGTFAGSSKTYARFRFIPDDDFGFLTFTGANTFSDFTVNSGHTLVFPAGQTTTITGTLSVNGTPTRTTTIQSSSAGSAATISKSSGIVRCDYLSIKDSTAAGGATFHAVCSTNVSGNTGWTFIPCSTDLILVPWADVSINSWTTQAGGTTNLYQSIDEIVADDADYIRSPTVPTGSQLYEGALEARADPMSSSGHIVHYRYQKNVAGGSIDLTVGLYQATTLIASWTHTNIPNAWTQADQALTSGQADSITDYSDLRLRFTPANAVSENAAPSKVADRGSANNETSSTTTVITLTNPTAITVGNYLIVRIAADNSGGGGAARSVTMSDSRSHTWTIGSPQANQDPGTASQGTTCTVVWVKVATAFQAGDTVTVTFSGAVVADAEVIEEWTGLTATQAAAFGSLNATTGASGTPSSGALSILATRTAYAAMSIEGPNSDSYTEDTDTTDGTWVTLTATGTSNATADLNQKIVGAYKAVTAAGNQSWDPTITNRDWAMLLGDLVSPAGTIRAQVSWANLEIPSWAAARLIVKQAVKRAAVI